MKTENKREKMRVPYHWTSPQTQLKHNYKVPWVAEFKVSSSLMKGYLGEREESEMIVF